MLALLGYGTRDEIFLNVYHGWLSVFYRIDDDNKDDQDYYGDYPSSIGIIAMYILSNAFVIYFMNNVLELSRNMMGRSIELAIIIAFMLLWCYDVINNSQDYHSGSSDSSWINAHHGVIDILAIILLILGMDIYDKGNLKYIIFYINVSKLKMLYMRCSFTISSIVSYFSLTFISQNFLYHNESRS